MNNDLKHELPREYESRSSLGYYNFNLNDYNSDRDRNESYQGQYEGRIVENNLNESYFKTTLTRSFFMNKDVSPLIKQNQKKGVLKITQQ